MRRSMSGRGLFCSGYCDVQIQTAAASNFVVEVPRLPPFFCHPILFHRVNPFFVNQRIDHARVGQNVLVHCILGQAALFAVDSNMVYAGLVAMGYIVAAGLVDLEGRISSSSGRQGSQLLLLAGGPPAYPGVTDSPLTSMVVLFTLNLTVRYLWPASCLAYPSAGFCRRHTDGNDEWAGQYRHATAGAHFACPYRCS